MSSSNAAPPSNAAPDGSAGSGSAGSAEPGPTPERTRSRVPHELWIAIITAVATIAAAVIGTAVAVDVGTVEVRVVGEGLDSTELQSAVDRLEAENAELRSANEDLQAQVGAQPGSGDAPEDDDAVRRATTEPISLAGAACIDLDSLESDEPNWDVAQEGDICVGFLDTFIGTDLTIMDGEPSQADCQAQTNLREDVGPVAAIVGSYVCAWTDGRRLARVQIVDRDGSGESATTTMNITVWEQQY